MKRFYLSPIIGTGTDDDPYRTKLSDYGVNHVAVIPNGADGRPLFNRALCIVASADHTQLVADGAIDRFPDLSLDAQMSSLTNAERTRIRNFLTNRNIAITFTNTDTYRSVLRKIGRHFDARFDENRFDVSE
jgi:hypothetical protein